MRTLLKRLRRKRRGIQPGAAINNKIRTYLNRMNIPEDVLTKMNAVPPSQIKWFGLDDNDPSQYAQLQDLHIVGIDPVFEDQTDSAAAKRWGLSKQEYYSRQFKVDAICPELVYVPGETSEKRMADIKARGACRQDVMSGRR